MATLDDDAVRCILAHACRMEVRRLFKPVVAVSTVGNTRSDSDKLVTLYLRSDDHELVTADGFIGGKETFLLNINFFAAICNAFFFSSKVKNPDV